MSTVDNEHFEERRRRVLDRSRNERELRQFTLRLVALMSALVALIVLGGVALWLTENVSLAFGMLWALDTITTIGSVGLPHDDTGRIVIVALEVFGIGTLFYGLATVAEFFVSGQLTGLLGQRRRQRMIDSYHDHVIVCGFGRVGRQISRDLRRDGVEHVAIDADPHNREDAEEMGVTFIESYAADDEVLSCAGVQRARAIIACVDSDADNIFIALTARELAPEILIVARASADESEKKLRRAGADRVISPYKTSGTEMARLALHPQVTGALDVGRHRMDEIEVSGACPAIGSTLDSVRGDAAIVAVRRADGSLEPQPAGDSAIAAGEILVAIGAPLALEALENRLEPTVAVKR